MNVHELQALAAAGHSDSEIADKLGVSSRTVLRWRQRHGIPSSFTYPPKAHGKLHTYRAGCRCEPCKQASRDHARRGRLDAQKATALAAAHFQPWTPEEDEVVLSDITIRSAALILGRTFCAVHSRRAVLRRRAGGAATA